MFLINFKQLEQTMWECSHHAHHESKHPLHYNILSSVIHIFFSKCPIFTEANGEYIQEIFRQTIKQNNLTQEYRYAT